MGGDKKPTTPLQEWYTAGKLESLKLGVKDFPKSNFRIGKRAKRDNYTYRDVPSRGPKGLVREYHIDSFPGNVRAAILLKQKPKTPARNTGKKNYSPESLWGWFNSMPQSLQDKAARKLSALVAAEKLSVSENISGFKARELVAQELGIHFTTILRWQQRIKDYQRQDWLPALCPKHTGRKPTEEYSPEAWEAFKSFYLHKSRPNYTTTYNYIMEICRANDWKFPSLDVVKRRFTEEISKEVQTLTREGEKALLELYPPQQRDKTALGALEWLNGDGYAHKVYVRFPGGEVVKAVSWLWQDLHSNYILGARSDVSENSDLIRLSLLDVVDDYGICDQITLDNTTSASNKWLTGGCGHRFRFPVKDTDPLGIIPQLGILHRFTTPGWPLGKPIERTFGIGGLGEYIDKHPLLRDHWSKDNPADLAVFIRARDEALSRWNNVKGRRSEVCGGKLSYKEAFFRSFAHRERRVLTASQRKLLLLPAEKIRVKKDGTFELLAGRCFGIGKNRYGCPELREHAGEYVAVRFDPQNLRADVYCQELNGKEIGTAHCIEKAGFGDTEAARVHNKKRRQMAKAAKKMAQAQKTMKSIELANLLPGDEEEKPATTKIVKPMFNKKPQLVKDGQPDDDLEDCSPDQTEVDRLFAKRMSELIAAEQAQY